MKTLFLTLGMILGFEAQASTITDATALLIKTGITDIDTVQHNTQIYNHVLDSIARNIDHPNYVLAQIDLLNGYLEEQVTFLGINFSPLIPSEIGSALATAKEAARNKQPETVLAMIKIAKKEIQAIQKLK